MDGDFASELRDYLYRTQANGVRLLENPRWVMNLEWLNDCRKADTAGGASWWVHVGLGKPEYLLGIPIEVREDGGVPHLERST